MGRRKFSREFKVSAVGLVQQQGYTVAQAAKSLGVDPGSLRGWLKQFPAGRHTDRPKARRRAGRAAPPARREQAADDGARDFKKSDGLLRQGVAMRYRFIQTHRERLADRSSVSRAGSQPQRLLRLAASAAKCHGRPPRASSPNASAQMHAATSSRQLRRTARASRTAGRRPPLQSQDGREADVSGRHAGQNVPRVPRDNHRFAARIADRRQSAGPPIPACGQTPGLDHGHHLHPDRRRLAVPGGGRRPLLAEDRRLGDVGTDRQRTGRRSAWTWRSCTSSHDAGLLAHSRSRRAVRQRSLPSSGWPSTASTAA